VHVAAGDDTGRERLFRYGARPQRRSIASAVFPMGATPAWAAPSTA
jgi:hypothetical protein